MVSKGYQVFQIQSDNKINEVKDWERRPHNSQRALLQVGENLKRERHSKGLEQSSRSDLEFWSINQRSCKHLVYGMSCKIDFFG